MFKSRWEIERFTQKKNGNICKSVNESQNAN